jgi:tRNA (guanine37-N1)-methyltransferase
MQIEVVSLFPVELRAALGFGVLGRAIADQRVRIGVTDPRSGTTDVHGTVDDRPYGGGPGMVGRPDVWAAAIDGAAAQLPAGSPRVYLSAQGERFDDGMARKMARLPGFVLVAGRYEGLDQRVIDARIDREISIGDYVLSGGEFAALVVIDAVCRLLPNVLGNEASAREESFASGLLDWPHYTRPPVWEGREVPPVLLSGDHAAIARWRRGEALRRTRERRPDLLEHGELEED